MEKLLIKKKKATRKHSIPMRHDVVSLFKKGKEFDWNIVLIISLVFLLSVLIYTGVEFFTVKSFIDGGKELKTRQTHVQIDDDRMALIQKTFEDRDEVFRRFNKNESFILQAVAVPDGGANSTSTSTATSTSITTSTETSSPVSTSTPSSNQTPTQTTETVATSTISNTQ